jgi:hypothetical protein
MIVNQKMMKLSLHWRAGDSGNGYQSLAGLS